jgi:hypothetical protein
MTDELRDGVWVVRVWREDDDGSIRARITATGGQAPTGSVSHRETWVVGSVADIERCLQNFLQSVVSGSPQHDRSGVLGAPVGELQCRRVINH